MKTKETILNMLETVNREGIKELIKDLEKSDYFTAPASVQHHGNYEGGLADHSYNVYKTFSIKLFNTALKEKIPIDTVIITSLLHDICKINFYKPEVRFKKINGKWKKYNSYVYEDQNPLGHGEKSVILLQNYIKLTDQEIMIIRWHMGPFLDQQQLRAYHNATEQYKEIVLFFCSDYEASIFLDKKIEPEYY